MDTVGGHIVMDIQQWCGLSSSENRSRNEVGQKGIDYRFRFDYRFSRGRWRRGRWIIMN